MTKKNSDNLTETAREIGSKLGEVHVKARRMVEGAKAAVKASRAVYAGGSKEKTTKKKARSARPSRKK